MLAVGLNKDTQQLKTKESSNSVDNSKRAPILFYKSLLNIKNYGSNKNIDMDIALDITKDLFNIHSDIAGLTADKNCSLQVTAVEECISCVIHISITMYNVINKRYIGAERGRMLSNWHNYWSKVLNIILQYSSTSEVRQRIAVRMFESAWKGKKY